MTTDATDEVTARAKTRRLAENRISAADFRGAADAFTAHLNVYPRDVEVLEWLSDLYLRTKRHELAVHALERLAHVQSERGSVQAAIDAYKQVNKLNPNRVYVYERLADLYAQQGMVAEAVAQITALADFYKRHADHQEAERLLTRAAEWQAKAPHPGLAPSRLESNPISGLPVEGVPIVRTTADMVIFLCHAKEDKPRIRQLHQRLRDDQFKPWIDEEDLLPGQEWRAEIEKALRRSHVALVCLSARSVTKAGFLQKEIAWALSILEEQPEGIIFVVPARLEACDVPSRLQQLHYVDLFETNGYSRLKRALLARARQLGFVHEAG